MPVFSRFVINRIYRSLYVAKKGLDKKFTAFLKDAQTYTTYEEAAAALEGLEEDYYQIDKVFKVKP